MDEEKRKELEKKMNEFKEAAKPLMKYLADNFHPHTSVIVDSTRAQLLEGVRAFKTEEFIKD